MPFLQDPQATLTLTRVASAPVLVAEIAQATGQTLEVSPILSTEILMVSVEKAAPAEVLAKIAVAASARWEPTANGYRLVADGGARNIEASAERARRLQAFTDAIKKRQAALAKVKADAQKGGAQADPEESGMGAAMGAMFGMGDGTDEFLPFLDLNALAGMEPGDRLVFASAPNAAQRALRGNVAPLVKAMIDGHNRMAKGMAGGMDEMPEEAAAFMKTPFGERMKKMSKPIVAAPAKVLVVASRGANPIFGGGDDIRLEVRTYAANGELLIEQTGSVGTNAMMEMVERAMKKPDAKAPASKTTPIAYSPEAKALMGMRESGGNFMVGPGLGGPKIPPALRERLFAPDKYEPLALLPGEGLAALAKARRKPLVACLPDAAYPGLLGGDAPDTVEAVESSLKTGPMRLVPDATFLVVKPAEPETARRSRLDRGALATLMRAVADHETPTLSEVADFAARTPAPSRNDVSMSFVSAFAPNVMGSMAGFISWDALRLYAALSPTQRASLTQGARVPFNTLNPPAQAALRALLYGAGDNLTVDRGGPVSDLPDVMTMGIKMMMGGGGVDARDEPTEVAPRGLPADGFLQAEVTQTPIIRLAGDDSPSPYSLGLDELAMFRMFSSGPMAQEMGEAMKMPESGRLGSRTSWNLRGYVAPGTYVGSTLLDDRTPKDGQRVTLGALPADLQAKVNERTERWKKSPLGMMMQMGAMMGRPKAQP